LGERISKGINMIANGKNTVNLNVQKKMKKPGIIIQFIPYIYCYDRRHCFEFYSSALVNLIVYGYTFVNTLTRAYFIVKKIQKECEFIVDYTN
jgi:hypothetical protein